MVGQNADDNDVTGYSRAGSVLGACWNGTGWEELFPKEANSFGSGTGDAFGWSVAVNYDCTVLAVGAPSIDHDVYGSNRGMVRLYSVQ